ncbi:MAG: signal peptide peptidase SppA [Candidatus Sericytochromatia bacterium]|nr:signal peptide peptidase SppA [Candidatus Sericytochromatia bacterium]
MISVARGLTGLGLSLVIPLTAWGVPVRPITGLAGSVALADEAQALLVNPAGLAFRNGWQGLFSKGWQGAGDGSLLVTGNGLGVGYEQGSLPTGDWQRGSLGLGVSLLPGLSLGLAGRAGQSGAGFTSLDAGLLWRPSDYFSLGASARDLTNPRIDGAVRPRTYQAGIGIRPGTDRLSFAVDLGWREGDPFTQLLPRFEVVAQPCGGINLRGAVDLQGSAEVGLSLGWTHGEVGHSQGLNNTSPATFAAFHTGFVKPFWAGDRTRLAELDLRGPIVSQVSQGLLGGSSGQSLYRVLEEIKTAKESPEIGGVIIRLGGTSASWAALDEIRQALAELQGTGKKVITYIYGVNTPEYYLACQADRVVIHPLGDLSIRGLSMQITHYKGLLDKLGVSADFVKIGEYKSAVEPMTLESMSTANRRQMEAILDDQFERLVKAIATSRKLEPAKVKALIDHAQFTAKEAKEAGLIDVIAYEDEVIKAASSWFGGKEPTMTRIGNRETYRTAWQDPDRIAIINADGALTEGRSGRNLLSGEAVLGADTLVKSIRLAANDMRVRAVVLRIDSPGGSVVASDIVWRELIKLKEAGKPLIISMGEVAASGGYWIATPADRIVADPGTLTGSIGVFAGKMSFGGLYQKLGIHQEVLKRGEKADSETDMRPFTEAERAVMKTSIESTYAVFLDRVAAARGLTRDEVDSRGRGRVYTGAQAKQLKLVDELGGLSKAVELARVMGRFPTHRVEVVQYPDSEAIMATLLDNEISISLQPMLYERLKRTQVMVLMPEGLLF